MNSQSTPAELSPSVLLDGLRAHMQALIVGPGRYDGLLALIGGARLPLFGEASHGTQEFYRERRAASRLLRP